VVTNAGVDIAQSTDDDIALMWLKNQSQVTTAVNALLATRRGPTPPRSSPSCPDAPAERFGNPLVDPRTPGPHRPAVPGTIYTVVAPRCRARRLWRGRHPCRHDRPPTALASWRRGNGGGNVVDDKVTTSRSRRRSSRPSTRPVQAGRSPHSSTRTSC